MCLLNFGSAFQDFSLWTKVPGKQKEEGTTSLFFSLNQLCPLKATSLSCFLLNYVGFFNKVCSKEQWRFEGTKTYTLWVGEQERVRVKGLQHSTNQSKTGQRKLGLGKVVEVHQEECIRMQDHLRDLGREIAKTHSPSRIWSERQSMNTQAPGIYSLRGTERLRMVELKAESLTAFETCIQSIKIEKWPSEMKICGRIFRRVHSVLDSFRFPGFHLAYTYDDAMRWLSLICQETNLSNKALLTGELVTFRDWFMVGERGSVIQGFKQNFQTLCKASSIS
ncbi:hypothetical protein SUGI_0684890 [Cryptomeria japonica]|nr:hypothetical protein SUGI_0684890 [Cryptomeria japonica]